MGLRTPRPKNELLEVGAQALQKGDQLQKLIAPDDGISPPLACWRSAGVNNAECADSSQASSFSQDHYTGEPAFAYPKLFLP